MLYSVLKIIARLALPLYCRKLQITNRHLLKHDGPLLLAVNHPNSFLDAIILCTLFKRPVYSLARGDAFKSKRAARILRWFKMLPVYRVSEGAENLGENYRTFDACREIFKKKGIVLIFIEGRCVNEWHLRPFKKGTARLVIGSWEQGISVDVLPVALNYSSFKVFGKNMKIHLGQVITPRDIVLNAGHGFALKSFNQMVRDQLEFSVFQAQKNDKKALFDYFHIPQSFLKKLILIVPAGLGFLIHAPFYYLVRFLNQWLIKEKGHYDSGMVSILMLSYPLYLFALCLVACLLKLGWWTFLIFLILPFTAWSYVQLKRQLD